jgi:integrase
MLSRPVSKSQEEGPRAFSSGREAVGFHALRYPFVTLMKERGTPLPVTMSLVGHMSARMTRNVGG